MRTLTQKYLGGLALDEDIYKVDLAVLDRYQSFSSELLRLSLLGIAGYGFLIANVVFKVTSENGNFLLIIPFFQTKFALAIGAVGLGISATTALGHRYFSTDCIAHYVRRLRLLKKRGDLDEGHPQWEIITGTINQEESSLEKDLNRCKWLLIVSSISLVLGAVCIAWAFASIIFSIPK